MLLVHTKAGMQGYIVAYEMCHPSRGVRLRGLLSRKEDLPWLWWPRVMGCAACDPGSPSGETRTTGGQGTKNDV